MPDILVIGTGSIGERHVRCMLATGRAAVGICEPNHDLRTQVRDRYSIAKAYDGLDTALQHRWNAAVISTPADSHVPLARRLAEAGIHLLIEKPLAVVPDGVHGLLDVIRRNNIVAAMAYVHRAHPMLTAFRETLHSGRFGEPLQFTVAAGHHFPTARPAYRTVYYASHQKGGGAVQDALSHLLDIGLWLVGPVTRLACDVAHQHLDGVTVEDTVHLICRHGNVMGSYTLNQYQGPTELTLTVVCSAGTMRYELHANRWLWATEPGGTWTIESCPPMERDDWFIRQESAFLDALEGVQPPLCTVADGMSTLRVTRAALRSSQAVLPIVE